MREICSYGSVGERGGNEPLYPENNESALVKLYFDTNILLKRFLSPFERTRKEVIICYLTGHYIPYIISQNTR